AGCGLQIRPGHRLGSLGGIPTHIVAGLHCHPEPNSTSRLVTVFMAAELESALVSVSSQIVTRLFPPPASAIARHGIIAFKQPRWRPFSTARPSSIITKPVRIIARW